MPTTHDGLARVLGPVDGTCVVVGAIIGVGIFFTPGRVAELAGPHLALLAWIIGGGVALMGALTFAELGGMYPRTGGQYEVLRDAYGPLPAFCFVFCNATAVQAGAIGIIAIVCVQNVGIAATGSMPEPVAVATGSLLAIATLAGANVAGVRWGARVQNLTVYAKLAALLAITAIGVVGSPEQSAAPAAAQPAISTGVLAGVAAALVPVLFSFGGWQQVLWVAGEVRDPHRNVPLATIGGVAIVIVAYLAANWAYLRLLGPDIIDSEAVAADAVAKVWPEVGRRAIAAAVAVSAFGVLNAQLLAGPRLIYGMARDGRFFRVFARPSPAFRTPVASIVLLSAIAMVLLVAAGQDGIDKLLTGVVLIDGCFFAMTGLAVIVLRHRRAHADRPVRVPLYPVVPLIFVAGEIAVIVGAHVDATARAAAYVGIAWIIAAAVMYLLLFRGNRGQAPPS